MPSATRAFIDRLALVFDFDLTLAPGTTDAVLARFGIDYATWRDRELDPLVESGWDEIQARGMLLRRLSRAQGGAIARDFLQEVGRGLEHFPQAQAALEARVENLAPPDYADGAPMRRILTLAVEILGNRVALRRLAVEAPPS